MFADQDADFAETISVNQRVYLRYQREMYLIFKIIRYQQSGKSNGHYLPLIP